MAVRYILSKNLLSLATYPPTDGQPQFSTPRRPMPQKKFRVAWHENPNDFAGLAPFSGIFRKAMKKILFAWLEIQKTRLTGYIITQETVRQSKKKFFTG
jgi:hypothetical protein